jgi:hypothetical protein
MAEPHPHFLSQHGVIGKGMKGLLKDQSSNVNSVTQVNSLKALDFS